MKTSTAHILFSWTIVFSFISIVMAADPDMLQDICVADLNSTLKVNGFPCKDSSKIDASDFSSDVLVNLPSPNSSIYGFGVRVADVTTVPGLNTLGICLGHVIFAPGGISPPHTHGQASEMVYLIDGELDAAFITSSNQLISKTLKKGEVFVIPRGLVHYQKNNGEVPAYALVAFNSHLLGFQAVGPALFAASPPVPDDVLTRAFQVGSEDVEKIKSGLAPKN